MRLKKSFVQKIPLFYGGTSKMHLGGPIRKLQALSFQELINFSCGFILLGDARAFLLGTREHASISKSNGNFLSILLQTFPQFVKQHHFFFSNMFIIKVIAQGSLINRVENIQQILSRNQVDLRLVLARFWVRFRSIFSRIEV